MRSCVEAILEIATELAMAAGFVVVGGYAVSARTRPRLSRDLDLVVHNDSLARIESILRRKGFTPGKGFTNPDKNIEYGDTTREWTLEEPEATVDVMAGGLMDRNVKIWIPYAKIVQGATIEGIPNTMGLNLQPRVSVASAEVLVGLKVQPLRGQDVVDLVGLAGIADMEGSSQTLVSMVGKEMARTRLTDLRRRFESSPLVGDYASAFQMKRPQAAEEIDRAIRFCGGMLAELGRR